MDVPISVEVERDPADPGHPWRDVREEEPGRHGLEERERILKCVEASVVLKDGERSEIETHADQTCDGELPNHAGGEHCKT